MLVEKTNIVDASCDHACMSLLEGIDITAAGQVLILLKVSSPDLNGDCEDARGDLHEWFVVEAVEGHLFLL